MFTGEMVFPWLFDDFAYLQPYKAAADLVAAKQDWPQLYSQHTLSRNKVTHCCFVAAVTCSQCCVTEPKMPCMIRSVAYVACSIRYLL